LRAYMSALGNNTPSAAKTVTPTSKRGHYVARLEDGRVLGKPSKQPLLDAARELLGLGYEPTTVLVMRHAGSDTDSLTCQIGPAAKLRVKEDRGGPRFVAWEPIPRRVEALASERAERGCRGQPTVLPTNPTSYPARLPTHENSLHLPQAREARR
jgi:hypothetical protein